jgi:hypothetical protein
MALDLAMAISLIVCRQDTSIDPEALTDTPWGQIECLVPTTELEAAESLVGQLSAKVAPEMIPDSVDDDRLARLIAHAFGVERSIRLLKRHCLIAPRDERAVARLEQLRISARSICTSSDLLIFRSKASESTRSVFASLEHHCGNMA